MSLIKLIWWVEMADKAVQSTERQPRRDTARINMVQYIISLPPGPLPYCLGYRLNKKERNSIVTPIRCPEVNESDGLDLGTRRQGLINQIHQLGQPRVLENEK